MSASLGCAVSSLHGAAIERARAPARLLTAPLTERPRRFTGHITRCAATGLSFIDRPAAGAADLPAAAGEAPKLEKRGAPKARGEKARVVVLGSGWGAVSFIKNIDPVAFGENGPYELLLVSPANHMVYTPLLPSAVGGVVSETSITESIRTLIAGKGTYYEARATDIDPFNRKLTFVKEFCEVCAMRAAKAGASGSGSHHHTEADHAFTIDYDILICSVGAVNATFGIQGVKENCWFLKTMEDAQKLRRHISKTIEHAALPDVSQEARKKLLNFVVVGGGPTGVEVAAELCDLVNEDIAHHLPHVKEDVSITLVDGLDSLLSSYHTEIQTYAGEVFEKSGIKLRLGAKVTFVHDEFIEVELKDGSKDTIPFGTCIWATGIAMHPLVAGLKAKLPEEVQNSRRGLVVDEHLRVLGTQGTVFCIGDAAVTGSTPQTSLPPTAQVARQEGEYLAHLVSRCSLGLRPAYSAWPARSHWPPTEADQDNAADIVPLPEDAKPFHYHHMGALAYLGGHKGVMDLPIKTRFLKTLRGYIGGSAWRSLETWLQVSHRTRWLVTHDWLRAAVFGRNISDI